MTDLATYANKRVVLVRNLSEPNENGESAVEIEGKVQAANDMGVLIKPKGRASFELIPAEEIEEIDLAPESDKKLRQKVLKIVELGGARQHLLDRHGYTLDEVNSMPESKAFALHEDLDHSTVGHRHENKESGEREAALKAAEADEAGEDDEGDEGDED